MLCYHELSQAGPAWQLLNAPASVQTRLPHACCSSSSTTSSMSACCCFRLPAVITPVLLRCNYPSTTDQRSNVVQCNAAHEHQACCSSSSTTSSMTCSLLPAAATSNPPSSMFSFASMVQTAPPLLAQTQAVPYQLTPAAAVEAPLPPRPACCCLLLFTQSSPVYLCAQVSTCCSDCCLLTCQVACSRHLSLNCSQLVVQQAIERCNMCC